MKQHKDDRHNLLYSDELERKGNRDDLYFVVIDLLIIGGVLCLAIKII